jgi:hypothetical protein
MTFCNTMAADNATEGWIYPDVVEYRKTTIRRWLGDAGLEGSALRWYHPRQTWWLAVHRGHELPSRRFRSLARGVSLTFPASWASRDTNAT